MTDAEVQPWVGKWIRATLADGRVLAGKLEQHGSHYTVMTPAPDKRESDTTEKVPSAAQIATIENAPEFGR
ncbi:MAG: hypothetical protein JO359_04410 [Candidatus Eremiobacteraeota bacterium]|nr:hypothetical protein [Candidatus Eremiobacteraeota bacterium]